MSVLLRLFPTLYRLSQWSDRRFTPAGKVVLGTATAAGLFGIDTTRTLGYQVFAVAAGLLAVSWVLAARWRPGLSVVRHAPPHAIVGAAVDYTVAITLRGRAASALQVRDELETPFPTAGQFRASARGPEVATNVFDRRVGFLRWLSLTERLRGGSVAPAVLPRLSASHTAEVTLSLRPSRRGRVRFSGLRVLRPDPLGLVNAGTRIPLPQELVVLPRVYPMPRIGLPGTRRHHRGGDRVAPQVGESQEFLQLRDYRAGDSPRRIHWPSTARAGRLVVRETGEEFFARHALVLDTFVDTPREASFEAAVSVAASVAGGLDLGDAFLDLMFVEDRVVTVSTGRQGALPMGSLRELAFVSPASRGAFDDLAARVLAKSDEVAACIHVFLALDAPRVSLIESLAARGVSQIVLAVDVAEPVPRIGSVAVHPVDSRAVGESLATLSVSPR